MGSGVFPQSSSATVPVGLRVCSQGGGASGETGLEGPPSSLFLPFAHKPTLDGWVLLEPQPSEETFKAATGGAPLPSGRGEAWGSQERVRVPSRGAQSAHSGSGTVVASAGQRQSQAHTDASVPKGWKWG